MPFCRLAEVGFYREVRVKSFESMLTRTLVAARNQMLKATTQLSNQIRGLMKTFGLVVPKSAGRVFEGQLDMRVLPDETAPGGARLRGSVELREALVREELVRQPALRGERRDLVQVHLHVEPDAALGGAAAVVLESHADLVRTLPQPFPSLHVEEVDAVEVVAVGGAIVLHINGPAPREAALSHDDALAPTGGDLHLRGDPM